MSAHARKLVDFIEAPHQRGITKLPSDWQEPTTLAFFSGLAELLCDASVEDCIVAGFDMANLEYPLTGSIFEYDYAMHVEFSPAFEHRVLSVEHRTWGGHLCWVDGRRLVPPDPPGERLQSTFMRTFWLSERIFAVDFYIPILIKSGNEFGLLIWDTERNVQHIEIPRDEERWPSPRIVLKGDTLHLYASDEDALHDRSPVRVLAIDKLG